MGFPEIFRNGLAFVVLIAPFNDGNSKKLLIK
jgi:hypothetical protein